MAELATEPRPAAAEEAPREERPAAAPRSTRLIAGLLVLALTALALGARLSGLDYLLPHMPEPDAYVVGQAQMIAEGSTEEARQTRIWSKYPHLLARMLGFFPENARPELPVLARYIEEHIEAAKQPMLDGRKLVAVLSCLLVPLTFLFSRRFLGPWPSLFAAALVATSLLHLAFSQQARPHGPLATFVLAALWGCCVAVERRGAAWAWALAGVLTGLAVACLHNAVALFLPLGAAFLLCHRKELGRAWWKGLIAIGPSVAAIPLFYPFLFDSVEATPIADQLEDGAEKPLAHEVRLEWFDGGGFEVIRQTLMGYDPVLAALLVVGLLVAVVGLRRGLGPRGREIAVVLAFALPYVLVIGLFRKSFERFLLPVYPLFACLAAVGAAALLRPLLRRLSGAAGTALAAVVGLALLAFPAYIDWRFLALHRQKDTLEEAARWARAQYSTQEDRLLIDTRLCLPLMYATRRLELPHDTEQMYFVPWEEYLRADPPKGRNPGTWDAAIMEGRAAWKRNPAALSYGKGRPTQEAIKVLRQKIAELDGTVAFVWAPGTNRLGSPISMAIKNLAKPEPLRINAMRDESDPATAEGYGKENMVSRVLSARCWGPAIDVYVMKD